MICSSRSARTRSASSIAFNVPRSSGSASVGAVRDSLALAVLGDGAGLVRRIGIDGDEPLVGVVGGARIRIGLDGDAVERIVAVARPLRRTTRQEVRPALLLQEAEANYLMRFDQPKFFLYKQHSNRYLLCAR